MKLIQIMRWGLSFGLLLMGIHLLQGQGTPGVAASVVAAEHLDEIQNARDVLKARAGEFVQRIKEIKAQKGASSPDVQANVLAMEQLRFCMAYLDFAKIEYLSLINVYENQKVSADFQPVLDLLGKINKSLAKYPLDLLQGMISELTLAIDLQKQVVDAWNDDELSQAQAIKNLEFLDQFFAFQNGFDAILRRIKWDLSGEQLNTVKVALQGAAVVLPSDYDAVDQDVVPASVTDSINLSSLLEDILKGKGDLYAAIVAAEKAEDSPSASMIKANEVYEAKMRFAWMVLKLKDLQYSMLLVANGESIDLKQKLIDLEADLSSFTGSRNIINDGDFASIKQRLNEALSEYQDLESAWSAGNLDSDALEDALSDLNAKYSYASFERFLKKIKWNFIGNQYSLIEPILKEPVVIRK